MKNTSTGFGLALLAGAIVACPILDRVMPRAEAGARHVAAATAKGAPVDLLPGASRSLGNLPCFTEDLFWLAPVPHFVAGCASMPTSGSDIHAADINADGGMEYFSMPDQVQLLANSEPLTYSDILVTRAVTVSDTTEIQAQRVLGSAYAGAAIRSAFPTCTAFQFYSASGWNGYHGWRDMDGDGDLDLVAIYTASGLPVELPASGTCWFENIGYEKPAPPIAADINGDGRVDGADLGMLLIAWGPTP